MKKIYHIYFVAVISFLSVGFLKAQCSGTPIGWGVTPANQTICAGNTATMMLITINPSTTSYSFQWQSSTVSSSGPWLPLTGVTGWSNTTAPTFTTTWFSVVVTCTTSGLSATFSCAVTVSNCGQPCSGQPATTSIVPLNQTVCAGTAANMSLATTYTNFGMTYQWGNAPSATGPFTAMPGATSSTYTSGPLLTTSYYNVTVTCANSSLSTIATQTVSVVSCTNCAGLPASNTVVPVNHTICAGTAATMSLTNTYTSSGITYQWQSSTVSSVGPFTSIPGATLSSYTTPVLNQTTFYSVIITCINGNQSISVLHTVTVLNCSGACFGAPASTSVLPVSHTLCVGDEPVMTLSTTYSNTGITYQWSSSTVQTGPYVAIPGATMSTYTAAPIFANTFYSVVITCTNSQLSTSVIHSVSVVNCTYCAGPPGTNSVLPSLPILCWSTFTQALQLANTYTVSGLTYQWQSSTVSPAGPFISINGATQNTLAVLPNTIGNLYFQVVITCTSTGKTTNVLKSYSVQICGGINENDSQPARVYPNPTQGVVEIMTTAGPLDVTLLDVSGRVIDSRKSSENKLRFDLNDLPAGLYLARIRHQGREEVIKLIKE